MPTRQFVQHCNPVTSSVLIFEWSGLKNGDDGAPLIIPHFADKSIHVRGTYGTGGTLVIEGSNEINPTSWDTLYDPWEKPLSFASGGKAIRAVMENTYQIRPRVTAGDSNTNLNVTIVLQTTR